MKLICDCGAELKFVIDKETNTDEDGFYARKDGDIEIHGEHDQVWFKCEKCETAFYIFT
jgi:hypothetical protein